MVYISMRSFGVREGISAKGVIFNEGFEIVPLSFTSITSVL